MGSYTTNYNLYLPSVGETGWGTLVNQNFTNLDTILNSGEGIRAANADKLTTARSFSITDGINTGTAVNFDGSANVSLRMPTTINTTDNIISNGHDNRIGNCWSTIYSGGLGDIAVLKIGIGRYATTLNENCIFHPIYTGFVGDFNVDVSSTSTVDCRLVIVGYSYASNAHGTFEIAVTNTVSLNHYIFSAYLTIGNGNYSYGVTLKCANPTFKIY